MNRNTGRRKRTGRRSRNTRQTRNLLWGLGWASLVLGFGLLAVSVLRGNTGFRWIGGVYICGALSLLALRAALVEMHNMAGDRRRREAASTRRLHGSS